MFVVGRIPLRGTVVQAGGRDSTVTGIGLVTFNQTSNYQFLALIRCNIPVCHEDQCGDGICYKPMMCKCPNGEVAKTCNDDTPVHEVSRCAEACLHGGRCINGECQCKEGWTGRDFQSDCLILITQSQNF